jgi:hypothetical protein
MLWFHAPVPVFTDRRIDPVINRLQPIPDPSTGWHRCALYPADQAGRRRLSSKPARAAPASPSVPSHIQLRLASPRMVS